MTRVLRETRSGGREPVRAGHRRAYNYIWGHQNLRETLERRCARLGYGLHRPLPFSGSDEAKALHSAGARRVAGGARERPACARVSISTHDPKFAAELACDGTLDATMIRYNAAHMGPRPTSSRICPNPVPAVTVSRRPAGRRCSAHRRVIHGSAFQRGRMLSLRLSIRRSTCP